MAVYSFSTRAAEDELIVSTVKREYNKQGLNFSTYIIGLIKNDLKQKEVCDDKRRIKG
jgi:hypothetical protein